MRFLEDNIIYETENLYLWRLNSHRFEIRLNGIQCSGSLVLGHTDNAEKAIKCMDKWERNGTVNAFRDHFNFH